MSAARREGRKEGRIEGRKEGRLEGRKEGRMEGKRENAILLAKKYMSLGHSAEEAAAFAEIDVDALK